MFGTEINSDYGDLVLERQVAWVFAVVLDRRSEGKERSDPADSAAEALRRNGDLEHKHARPFSIGLKTVSECNLDDPLRVPVGREGQEWTWEEGDGWIAVCLADTTDGQIDEKPPKWKLIDPPRSTDEDSRTLGEADLLYRDLVNWRDEAESILKEISHQMGSCTPFLEVLARGGVLE